MTSPVRCGTKVRCIGHPRLWLVGSDWLRGQRPGRNRFRTPPCPINQSCLAATPSGYTSQLSLNTLHQYVTSTVPRSATYQAVLQPLSESTICPIILVQPPIAIFSPRIVRPPGRPAAWNSPHRTLRGLLAVASLVDGAVDWRPIAPLLHRWIDRTLWI